MSAGRGWIGHIDELLNYLRVVRADQNADGSFQIWGEPVIAGLDPTEVVVPAGAEYSINGHRCNLAAALGDISGGVSVTVIS